MTISSDLVVVGGGVVGAACARALVRAGARVTLVTHSGNAGEASRAAAGMLAAQIEAEPDDPLFAFGVAGRAFYRREAEALEAATGISLAFKQSGILEVAFSESQVEAFKAKVAWQRQQTYRAEWLGPEEVHQEWPWLASGLGAFWAPEDGSVSPTGLLDALIADAVAGGARVVDDLVIGLDRQGNQLRGVIGTNERYAAGIVVLAAGAWAARLEDLPRPIAVQPIRGQMVAFPWPDQAKTTVAYGDHCYLVRRNGEMLVGSTMEHAGFDAQPTADGISDLIDRAATLYPAIRGLTPLRTWAGLRPCTPDGLPIIGEEPRCPGLWYAAGHGRNGILLAGITGELIAEAIVGEPFPEMMRPFRPERFWDW